MIFQTFDMDKLWRNSIDNARKNDLKSTTLSSLIVNYWKLTQKKVAPQSRFTIIILPPLYKSL